MAKAIKNTPVFRLEALFRECNLCCDLCGLYFDLLYFNYMNKEKQHVTLLFLQRNTSNHKSSLQVHVTELFLTFP